MAYNPEPHQNSTNPHFPSAGTYISNGQATSSLGVSYQPLQSASQAPVSVSEETPTITQFQVINENRAPDERESMVYTHERLGYYLCYCFHLAHGLCRLNTRIANDHNMVTHPDMDSPFLDESDAIERLLPYHIFQQPRLDLLRATSGKGKEKAFETDWKKEIQGEIALSML